MPVHAHQDRQPAQHKATSEYQTALPDNQILQLQRTIGNTATAAVVHNAPLSPPSTPGATGQMLALQRAIGNQAASRLVGQSSNTRIQRWPWNRKKSSQTTTSTTTSGRPLAMFDEMRKDPQLALAQQSQSGQQNQQNPLTQSQSGQQNQNPLTQSQSGQQSQQNQQATQPQQNTQQPPPPKFLQNITPKAKAIEDPDHANIIEGLSLTSTTTDAIGSMLSNAGGTLQSAKYDSVYQSFLREQGLPLNTVEADLTDAQAEALEKKEIEEGGLRTLAENADVRADLNIASSGMGVGIGAFTTVAGLFGLVDAWKKFRKNTDPAKRANLIMELVNQGTVGAIGGLQTASSLGGTISSAVSKYQPDNSAAEAASNSFSGLGDIFGSLGGMVEMFVTGIRGMKGAIDLFRGVGEGSKREQGMQIAAEFIKSGKAFLMTGKSAISAAKTFMDIAGTANAFTSAVPIIGAAVNIVVQFVDTGLQILDGIRQAIKIAEARLMAGKMQKQLNDENSKQNKDANRVSYLQKMVEINIKRVKRAVIPLITSISNSIANIISIGGSILNIVGAATSAAYGAGVGIMAAGYAATGTSAVMKLSGAAAKPIAAGVRMIKQKGRDMAEKSPTGVAAKVFKFNADKSTEKKKQAYIQHAQQLFEVITALPDKYDANNAQEKQQYDDAYLMLEATGVNVEELFKKNGDPKDQMLMIIEAMQVRE